MSRHQDRRLIAGHLAAQLGADGTAAVPVTITDLPRRYSRTSAVWMRTGSRPAALPCSTLHFAHLDTAGHHAAMAGTTTSPLPERRRWPPRRAPRDVGHRDDGVADLASLAIRSDRRSGQHLSDARPRPALLSSSAGPLPATRPAGELAHQADRRIAGAQHHHRLAEGPQPTIKPGFLPGAVEHPRAAQDTPSPSSSRLHRKDQPRHFRRGAHRHHHHQPARATRTPPPPAQCRRDPAGWRRPRRSGTAQSPQQQGLEHQRDDQPSIEAWR